MAATEGAGSLRALLNWWGALVGLLEMRRLVKRVGGSRVVRSF